jgi:hypothetical protein
MNPQRRLVNATQMAQSDKQVPPTADSTWIRVAPSPTAARALSNVGETMNDKGKLGGLTEPRRSRNTAVDSFVSALKVQAHGPRSPTNPTGRSQQRGKVRRMPLPQPEPPDRRVPRSEGLPFQNRSRCVDNRCLHGTSITSNQRFGEIGPIGDLSLLLSMALATIEHTNINLIVRGPMPDPTFLS